MIHYLQGKQDIKSVFLQAIDSNKERILYTALSDKPIVYFLGEDFADEYMENRKNGGIFLKSLRLTQKQVDTSQHSDYQSYNKEARIAPHGIHLDNSVVFWDDFVAIINTETMEGKLIHDQDYVDVIKNWYEYIWDQSIKKI